MAYPAQHAARQAWGLDRGKGTASHREVSAQGPWGVALSVCQRNSGVNKWMSGRVSGRLELSLWPLRLRRTGPLGGWEI